MNNLNAEKTLFGVRLHWGVFLMPLLATVAMATFLALPPILYWAFLQKLLVAAGSGRLKYPFVASIMPVVALPALGAGGVLLLLTLSAYWNCRVTLTDRRIIFRAGVFRRLSGEIQLNNVNSVLVSESILGRACGYCSILIGSTGMSRITFPYFPSNRNSLLALETAVSAPKLGAPGSTFGHEIGATAIDSEKSGGISDGQAIGVKPQMATATLVCRVS